MADLLSKVVVPVADEDVAEESARAAENYLDEDSHVVLVHVVDEDDDGDDEWAAFAEAAFDSARDVLGADRVSTEIRHADDVVDEVFAVAGDVDASAVVFRSRGGSRWRQLMAGDVARELVTEAEHPVVVLPRGGD